MSLLVATPVILPPLPGVLESWTHRPHLIVVNGAHRKWRKILSTVDPAINSTIWDDETNHGVAASWNNAMERAAGNAIEYGGVTHVALMSQNIILTGGTARLAELVEEHADWRGLHTDFAWRCIVISVKLWETLGPFDEHFSPAYYEDSDYVRRLELANLHTAENPLVYLGEKLTGSVLEEARTLQSGVIDKASYWRNARRYRDKWGGDPFQERFTQPYNQEG